MENKESVRRLWAETFRDSPEYLQMYFERVYREDDVLKIESNGKLDSSMLLQRYTMLFQQSEVGLAYVAGAMTRQGARGRGLMSCLMKEALSAARERGDMVLALIPAHDWLYFFYDRFGLATVFYVDPQRFTSLHHFAPENEYTPVENPFSDEVFEKFRELERSRGCSILHSHRDFLNILEDNRLDGGRFVSMRGPSGEVESMAWAVVGKEMVTVTELLGINHDAREGALAMLRKLLPDLPFKVLAPPLSEHRHLYSRGMARIVNVGLCLEKIAKAHPEWRCTLRVSDPLLPENDGIYIAGKGEVAVHGLDEKIKPDLDVNITVLTEIVFSSPSIGYVMGVPSERPVISLMLE